MKPALFATRVDLLAWLAQHGISHVARFNLEALAPQLDPSLWPALHAVGRRRRVLDVGSLEDLAHVSSWLPAGLLAADLPHAVVRFLDSERRAAEQARALVPDRLLPPAEPRARDVHARLCDLRSRVPDDVAPRLAAALPRQDLCFDGTLPGFRAVDPQPFEATLRAGGGFVRPQARLFLAPGALRADCTCGDSACVHVLTTIDGALAWLQQPPNDTFLHTLEQLQRPHWERTLAAFDRLLDGDPAARAGLVLTWRLAVVDDLGVEVTAWVQKIGKKGTPGVAVRLPRRRLLLEHGATLAPQDARIAALLPPVDAFASRALLEALIDQPHVVLRDAPDQTVRIERAVVGLVAEQRHDAVRVSAGLDGASLPPGLLERVRRARPDDALFVWDGRLLTLLDVKRELRDLLDVLRREGDLFPLESVRQLLPTLAKWAGRLPVALPRSMMGETVAALVLPVLRLQAQADGTVEVAVRVCPLPDGPSLVPGHGARDVHVRRGEKAVHAVRDLDAESSVSKTFCRELPFALANALDGPFEFAFPDEQSALALLAACLERDPVPGFEWIGAPLQVLGRRGPGALKVTVRRQHEWFGVWGELTVASDRVELASLLDAARRGHRFVRVSSNSYVELSETLREHLARVADHAQIDRRGITVGPAAVDTLEQLTASGVTCDADATWRQLAARVEASRDHVAALLPGLHGELRPYQRDGFRWLARLAFWGAGGILADDMGLGKTVQTLALLLERQAQGPALVVAPTSVAFNWCEEASRFAPSLRLVLYGDSTDRAESLAALTAGDVLVISYGLLVRDAKRLATHRFATILFDEAQQLKNAATQRFRAARALQGDVRFALSGTPMENHLGELWSLFALVFPTLLGSWESFRRRYAAPIEKQLDPAAAPALARVVNPFLLRRTKAQVEPDLPPRTDVRVPVVLSSAEWQLYEDARLAILSDLETPKAKRRAQNRRVEVLAALTRLRLLASHPRLYDPRSELTSSKLTRVLELIDELCAESQRALVFSQFTSHLALLKDALTARGVPFVYLDGETPAGERGERVQSFQEGTAPLFLLSLKAGGFGLNLTAASNVLHLDPWWNPAVEDQASDRAHRPGQRQPVTVYRLIAMGTIEEHMLTLHARKRSLVADVLSGKDQAANLSTSELLALLGPSSGSSLSPGVSAKPPLW